MDGNDCCYIELFLKCDGSPNPNLKCIDKFRLINKVFHLPFTCSKYQKRHKNDVSNIFRVSNKDTRTTSGTSFVNFNHISLFNLLMVLFLNSNK